MPLAFGLPIRFNLQRMARLYHMIRGALAALAGVLRGLARGCLGLWRRVAVGRWFAILPMLLAGLWVGWIAVDRTGVRAGLENAAREFVSLHRIRQFRKELLFAGEEAGVDPNLLAGILWTESSGRIDVVSSAGAMGLFQLKPITFEWRAEIMGLPIPTEEQILSDPMLNARIGANNLAWLLDTHDGNVARALIAYNAGPGRLKQLENKAGGWERLEQQLRSSGDSQLLAYVDKVLRTAATVREEGVLGENPSYPRQLPKPQGN